MTSLDEWMGEKDSRICIYVDLEERQEMEDPRWMMNQESQEGKVKAHKDPRWKEEMKPLVLVEDVQGWTWKIKRKINKFINIFRMTIRIFNRIMSILNKSNLFDRST